MTSVSIPLKVQFGAVNLDKKYHTNKRFAEGFLRIITGKKSSMCNPMKRHGQRQYHYFSVNQVFQRTQYTQKTLPSGAKYDIRHKTMTGNE